MDQPQEPSSRGDSSEEPIIIDDDEAPSDAPLDPKRAFEVLEIRTPLEELETFGRARIDTLEKLGEGDRAALTAEALELGRRAIARVTGVAVPERSARDAGRSS